MRIVVCAKSVPGGMLEMRLDSATRRLVRSGRFVLNDGDRYAVEAAAQLKAASTGTEVVVVMMAPNAATAAIREALAVGADRAVHVADGTLEGSDLLGTSAVLARAVAAEEPDLVLFGPQSDDGAGGLMPAAVAQRLRLPSIPQAVELDLVEGAVVARHQTEHGYETLRAPLPCLVSVASGLNQPRFASVKAKVAARNKPVRLHTVAQLGLEPSDVGAAGARTTVLEIASPPARPPAAVVKADDAPAERIFEFLSSKGLV